MKLIDALLNVDKSKQNSSCPDIEAFAYAANVSEYDVGYTEFETGLVGYWVFVHYCTDTWVGLQAVYLHEELVGYTYQTARKNDVDLKFISDEAAKKTVAFVQSCCEVNDYYIIEENLDQEIDDLSSVYYSNQLLEKSGFYEGKPCTLINKRVEPTNYISTKILVQFEDGSEQVIEAENFKYPLRLTKDSK